MSGRAWREAERLQRELQWADAGAAWLDIAERAYEKGDLARTSEAAARAGDAFRRDDRPVAAARSFKLAWDSGRRSPIDAALLAGALVDAGQADVALDLLDPHAAMDAAASIDASGRAILLDVRLGLRLALGQVEAARADLAELDRLDVPGGNISRVFRQAQLDRLDGLLERADQGFKAALAGLSDIRGPQGVAAGPMAAAMGERGELALLCAALGQGAPEDALVHLEGAVAGWRAAGRAGPERRAQSWVLRARAAMGDAVLAEPILEWAEGADERGMPLLAADLRVSWAIAAADPSGLPAVARTLDRAPIAQARVRVVQAELEGPDGRGADLDAALAALGADAPWFARGLRALGRRERDVTLLADAEARIEAFFRA